MTRFPRAMPTALMAALFIAAMPADRPRAVGRVLGTVLEGETGRPLEGADVRLGSQQGATDRQGRVLFPEVPGGSAVVETRLIGYVSRTDSIVVPMDGTLDMQIRLSRDPVEIAPITAEVRSRVLELRGFYERASSGYAGYFFTKADLEERNARDLTELLGPLPGVRLLGSGLEGNRVVLERATSLAGGGLCEPALFLDGVKSRTRLYDLILDPSHVEGVEIYIGAAIPGRYNDPCGAVLVWTRIP